MDPTTLTMFGGGLIGAIYTFLHAKGIGLTPAPILPGIPANLAGIGAEILKAALTHSAGGVVNAVASSALQWAGTQGITLLDSFIDRIAHKAVEKLQAKLAQPPAPEVKP